MLLQDVQSMYSWYILFNHDMRLFEMVLFIRLSGFFFFLRKQHLWPRSEAIINMLWAAANFNQSKTFYWIRTSQFTILIFFYRKSTLVLPFFQILPLVVEWKPLQWQWQSQNILRQNCWICCQYYNGSYVLLSFKGVYLVLLKTWKSQSCS